MTTFPLKRGAAVVTALLFLITNLHPVSFAAELPPPQAQMSGTLPHELRQISIPSGIGKIEERILELTDFLIRGLRARGLRVVSPREPEHRSGIVVFESARAKDICRRLLGKGIFVSPRGAGIRVAPHFYNTREELETFLKKLVEYIHGK